MKLRDEEKAKLIEFNFDTKSIVKAQRGYPRHFGLKSASRPKGSVEDCKEFSN